MAETTRTTDHAVSVEGEGGAPAGVTHPLVDALRRHPRRFTFYQALRILHHFGEGSSLGTQSLPRQEAIRLRALDALAFPPWDIDRIESEKNPWQRPDQRLVLTVNFMGLYGPASPMPASYTEMLIRPEDEEEPEDRARVRAFLDIFNHRMLSLFFRALEKYRYHLLFEAGGQDRFSGYLLSLIGRGTDHMPQDRPVEAIRLMRYAGILSQMPRCMSNLAGMLRDYLKVNVRILQCQGRWLRVEDTNRLGQGFCALGQDMIVGANVFDRNSKIRISIGPVGLEAFKRFLPTGQTMQQLKELVRVYLVDEFEFDVEVWLKGDEVPSASLGDGPGAAMLGWTSWAVSEPGPDRAVVFRI